MEIDDHMGTVMLILEPTRLVEQLRDTFSSLQEAHSAGGANCTNLFLLVRASPKLMLSILLSQLFVKRVGSSRYSKRLVIHS
jgi:hypothetical protein